MDKMEVFCLGYWYRENERGKSEFMLFLSRLSHLQEVLKLLPRSYLQ